MGALIPLLAVHGESCNNVEDPIKRDEAASGPWNVSRVEWKPSGLQGALIPVTLGDSHPLGRTALYEGDSYVIQYAVGEGRSPDVIYFWQGSSSSRFEKGASAILAVQVDDATGGRAKQARVVFGEEPAHFLNMMGGDFITLQGGVERKKPTVQDNDGVMLLRYFPLYINHLHLDASSVQCTYMNLIIKSFIRGFYSTYVDIHH